MLDIASAWSYVDVPFVDHLWWIISLAFDLAQILPAWIFLSVSWATEGVAYTGSSSLSSPVFPVSELGSSHCVICSAIRDSDKLRISGELKKKKKSMCPGLSFWSSL